MWRRADLTSKIHNKRPESRILYSERTLGQNRCLPVEQNFPAEQAPKIEKKHIVHLKFAHNKCYTAIAAKWEPLDSSNKYAPCHHSINESFSLKIMLG